MDANAPLLRLMKFGPKEYSFAIKGPDGAIEFLYDHQNNGDHSWLSFHYAYQKYDHQNVQKCVFNLGGCYGDMACGWAKEYINPIFEVCNNTHDFERLWNELEEIYAGRIARQEVAQ